MSLERKLEHVKKRKWDTVRDAWLGNIPDFRTLGSRPDPGLEQLPTLQTVNLPEIDDPPFRVQDVEGIRRNLLWEAIFLFHKCAHTSLAAQRLGEQGMHSWCMFNAYHSAYLGAKGILALLGVGLPSLGGRQVLIDLFPEDVKSKKKAAPKVSSHFQEFHIIRLHPLDQQGLWAAFQRLLRVTTVKCWDTNLQKELVTIGCKKITPPRNGFLYKAHYWPLDDLLSDAALQELKTLAGTELDADDKGFLLRLGFSVYRLFEQLVLDLSSYSTVVKQQFDGSRVFVNAGLPVLQNYTDFVSQVSSPQ